MTKPTPNLRSNPDVISQTLGKEAVLLHLETEVYYSLDETGLRMWQLIGEYGEPQAIISRMQEEFDVDETTLKNDFSRLVDELIKEGLLDVEN